MVFVVGKHASGLRSSDHAACAPKNTDVTTQDKDHKKKPKRSACSIENVLQCGLVVGAQITPGQDNPPQFYIISDK